MRRIWTQQVAQARQQVLQAERQLDQQKSQLALATVTVQRYRVLVRKGVFSRQDGDTAGGELRVAGGECASRTKECGCVPRESRQHVRAAEL